MTEPDPEVSPFEASPGEPVPGKPYIRMPLNAQHIGMLDAIIKEKDKRLLQPGGVREYVRDYVHRTLQENLPGGQERAIKWADKEIDALSEKIDVLGEIELQAADSPVVKEVAEAAEEYNRAHPEAHVVAPKYVIAAEKIGTLYHVGMDAMVVDAKTLALPVEERRAIIAHELGHKAQAQDGAMSVNTYDVRAHVDAVAPNLYDACLENGFTFSEIERALPSNLFAEVTQLNIGNAKKYWEKIIRMPDYLDAVSSPWETLSLENKLRNNPECDREVDRVHDTLPEALETLSRDSNAEMRRLEADADRRAAETYGAQAMAEALLHLHRAYGISYTAQQEEAYDHPSLESRVADIGCSIRHDVGGGESVECPNVVDHRPEQSSAPRK